MSVSAISQSTVLATAPAPKRLHYGEAGAEEKRQKAMLRRAIQLVEKAGGEYASVNQKEEVQNILKAEFNIDYEIAGSLVAATGNEIHNKNYGEARNRAPDSTIAFTSPQAQKDFARSKMGQLEYGVQNYNIGIKLWSPEKIIEERVNGWNKTYAKRLEFNGNDEAEAIKFADKVLKTTMEMLSSGGGDYDIRLALGGLQAGFGALPANLLVENADGTLSINRDALKDTALGNALNIGSPIGQNLDQAA